MIDDLIDRADALFGRWHVLLTVLSAAWFAATCAEYAGFIDLPIPALVSLPGWAAVLPAAIWNAIWWGFAYPRIEARRAERTNMENSDG